MMFPTEQYAYAGKLRGVHPLEKFSFAVVTMTLGLAVNRPEIYVIITVLMLGVLVGKAGIPGAVVLKMLLVPLAFLLPGAAAVSLSVGPAEGETLWQFSVAGCKVGFTAAGLSLAGHTVLKSLGSVSCLYFLAFTTPVTELVYVLKLLRFPGIIVELVVLIYRFIFIFMESAWQLYVAQSARWGYSSFRRSLASMGVLLANIWAKAFLRAGRVLTGLNSRCYDGKLGFIDAPYVFSLRNIIFIVLLEGVLLLLARY
ncbi:MAG: cobalt ECF transporter T component CbiQ [Peptococcaceae bacterium]|jgi:cobalt/nickel transport system permease protein|nr:cobalt ECF transporter T component CbiQ [Peptococcaceae bacterium]MDH7525807.1 cobalt ECF transporter T component CbiQ [Peptococcaceae bacterium]